MSNSMDQLLLFYLVALAAYVIGIRLFFWRFFTQFQKRIFLLLNVITFAVYLLYFFNILSTPQTLPFWNWFMDVNEEFGLMATYSSAILLLTAIAAFFNGMFDGGRRRGFWILNAFVFLFLTLDEYFVIHEAIQEAVGNWQIIYMVSGAVLVLLSILFWWPKSRQQWIQLVLYLIGLGVLGGSGIVLDYVFQEVACRTELGIICADLNLIEEVMETLGACFVLALFLSIAVETVPMRGRKIYWGTLVSAAAIWVVGVMGYWWLLPTLELQTANRVDVGFDDGRVSLVAYTLSSHEVAPDGTLTVTTYWRANEPVTKLYQISGHILDRSYNSIAQDDPTAGWFPSYAWFPNVTIRKTLNLHIPATIDAPYGYLVSMRLWNFKDPEELSPVSGDRPVLFADTVQLDAVTSLSTDELPSVPNSNSYIFSDNIRMLGYQMPLVATPGEIITVRFWWDVESAAPADYAQFLHFVPDDPQESVVFDQIPLDGRLPTANWIPGLRFVDTWDIQIPTDAPIGTYEVISGFFNQFTGERLPVSGINNSPTRDVSMVLGTIDVVRP
ncbi:MAG: hypothetical protein KC615_01940 [Anaerolineae bacterium]|nr:hypothetical protein [Anaerolineae bacterium]